MPVVVRTDQVEDDLAGILRDLARKSVTAGRRVVHLIDQKCARYATMPDLGILRDDLAVGLRCFPVWGFLVFYRPIDGGIEVLRILHGSRNIDPSYFVP